MKFELKTTISVAVARFQAGMGVEIYGQLRRFSTTYSKFNFFTKTTM